MQTAINHVDQSESHLVAAVDSALSLAQSLPSRPGNEIYLIPGMSGWRFRAFLNGLGHRVTLARTLGNPRYLEIGSYRGATMCAMLADNPMVRAVSVDNWSEFQDEGNPPQAEFKRNVSRHGAGPFQVQQVEKDFREVSFSGDPRAAFNIFLYDGPHTEQDQFDGLVCPAPALARQFVLLVDDWNWETTRSGTLHAIEQLGLTALYWTELFTTEDGNHPPREASGGDSEWHNGVLIAVMEKP